MPLDTNSLFTLAGSERNPRNDIETPAVTWQYHYSSASKVAIH